ncbi:transposase, partial [Acidisoma silvae]|nr:transposase [Acidisoma silvae]
MRALIAVGPNICVISAERRDEGWLIVASGPGHGPCPSCACHSSARHSTYWRNLRDLPLQGSPVMVRLRLARLRCREPTCDQQIFAERLPGVITPLLRRTCRVVDLMQAVGHVAGGKPAERLLSRLGLPASDDTVLRHVKHRARVNAIRAPLRVVGVDDWSWTKGQSYGTIMVDLERRRV